MRRGRGIIYDCIYYNDDHDNDQHDNYDNYNDNNQHYYDPGTVPYLR